MLKLITTLLDLLAVLLIAAGVGAGVFPWVGWWALAVSGAVLLGASQLVVFVAAKPPGTKT